ncbi:MAG: NAD-dependent epimerase/dehydratase family protein [Gemmatimonadaceae bacterium]
MSNRRKFVRQSAASLGAFALGPALARAGSFPDAEYRASRRPRTAPLNVLVLGGTGFIGPHGVRYAVARGHKVTVFNRGRRQADLPESVQHLQGDRDTGDLASLKGKTWDVVIDNPTTLPFWVRDVGQILQGNTSQYIFVSTISTYAHYQKAGMDENYELAKYTGAEDPMTIKRSSGNLYGPLKVLSEREAEKWFPGKTTVVRPGLIVGPGDPTDRFSYWPVRIDRGGEVLAPGTPADPTQIIDVRDLTEFIVRLAEDKVTGIYNATGPRAPLSMAEMLYGCRAATSGSNDVSFTWVDAAFLTEQKVRGWSDMPTWLPTREDNAGWGRVSIARAVEKGLTFRPLALTARDTIDWFKTLPAERQAKMVSGLTAEREKEVLAAWHAKRAG